jgi:HEAT repeat protein
MIYKTVAILLVARVCVGAGVAAPDAAPNEALLRMVCDLLGDADPEMRALGQEQVRGTAAVGAAATARFAALLPNLSADAQTGLVEALADRGDASARPAVVALLGSKEPRVRAECLKALGALGSGADVPLLASNCAKGTEAERDAARHGLVRLRGKDVDAALLAAMAGAPPAVRIEIIAALAARRADEALSLALRSAGDADAGVRRAALAAVRDLAGQKEAPVLVGPLIRSFEAARTEDERDEAEEVLLTVCGRGRQACVEAVLAAMDGAGTPARVVLLRGLGRCGGEKALGEVLARMKDPDPAVRDEAVRVLATWAGREAAPHLIEMARAAGDRRTRILAFRGCVRLARGDPPDVAMLAEALELAPRPEERRLVLGALGDVASPQSLALAVGCLEDPAVADAAGAAVVRMAAKFSAGQRDQVRAALEHVLRRVRHPEVRARAQQMLGALGR